MASTCDLVIQVGDVDDLYNFSKYTKNPNLMSPEAEVSAAREHVERLWARVKKRAPKAKRYQLRGNHDGRVEKRIAENLPEIGVFASRGIRDFYTFDGVTTIHDPTEELILPVAGQDVCFMHGHRSKLGDHARYNQLATVTGHSHHGGVVYLRHRDRVFWELNAGWLGDERAPVFRYGNQKLLKTWTKGFGLIDHLGPRFCPLS